MSERLKVQVKAERNMFSKLTGRYVAILGALRAVGTTMAEAESILGEQLSDAEHFSCARRYLITPGGTVFSLYHIPFSGWAYDIVHTHSSGKPQVGAYSAGSCMLANGTSFVDAYAQMKAHWEQYCAQDKPLVAA